MISSAVFVPAAALQIKFPLSSKLLKNVGSMVKRSTYALSTSRKHTTGFLVKSFVECCGCTVLTAACYWPSSHFISAQKFVSVSGELNHDCSLLDSDKVCAVITPSHSLTLHELDRQSQPSRRGCHSWELQDQPFTFCRRFGTASIFTAVSSACICSVFCCV